MEGREKEGEGKMRKRGNERRKEEEERKGKEGARDKALCSKFLRL